MTNVQHWLVFRLLRCAPGTYAHWLVFWLQDLLIPFVHKPRAYKHSPLQGAPPRERTTLLFFRGDVGKYR